MGADQDIHLALAQICHRFFLLRARAEPAHQIDAHGKILHSLLEGIIVLLCQNGGGHQESHLLSVLYRFKSRPDGDLRLAVAHVPADQAVHDSVALHILLGGGDGGELILRFLEGEHFLKFLLPDRILTEGKALLLLPYRIQLHQILCHLVHGTAHPRLGTGPFLGAQLVQLRCLGGIRRSILLDHIQAGGEHVQISAVPVGNLDIVLDGAVHLHLFNALIDSEPVGFMHHIVAHLQFGEILDLLAFKLPAALLFFLLRPENVALRDDHEFQQGIFKAPAHMAVKQFHLSRLYLSVAILAVKACKAFRLQILRKPLCPGPGRGQKKHPAAVFLIPLQIRRQRFKTVVVGGHAFHIDIKPPLRSDENVSGVHG